jgi:hypothetical protein
MSPTGQPIEWYIARDGRQHGPLNDGEMQKLVELGHLRPTDLVWRAGMTDWRLASVVFQRSTPPVKPAPPPAARPQPQAHHPQPAVAQPEVAARPAPAPQPSPTPTYTQPSQPDPRARTAAGQHVPVAAPVATTAAAPAPASTMPVRADTPEPAADDYDDDESDRPQWRRQIAILAGVALISAASAYGLNTLGYTKSIPGLSSMVAPIKSLVGGLMPGSGSHAAETLTLPPFVAAGDTPEAIDGALQKAAVWKVAKREFPEWYAERLKETAGMRAAKSENVVVSRRLAESFVALRRKHADQALAAAPEHVGSVATAFLDSLRAFSKHSVEACYGYISQGEINPAVLQLAATNPHAGQLHKQVTAVLDAIADGRRSPRTYLPPRKGDYDVLAKELTSRGWSEADLKIFSDPKELARSSPDQVCKMVQDWFAAQMGIKDAEIRQRLLIESLRPVVAG